MPRASDAKSRFIETAIRLFRERGYNGVGIAEVIAHSGAPKGSFYHHFPEGKEELAAAAVRLAGQRIAVFADRILLAEPSFAAGCARIAREIGDGFARSGFREGCPVTAVAIDAVPGSPRLENAVRDVVERWVELAAAHAERLGERDPRDKAERFFMAVEGAWIMARVMQSKAPFEAVARLP